MLLGVVQRRVQALILFVVVGMTWVVTPWMNLDPINLPKFLILVVAGAGLIGNLFPYFGRLLGAETQLVVLGFCLFVFGLLLSYLVHGLGNNQLYGAYGRNTGLLAYLFLAVCFVGVILVSSGKFLARILLALVVTGVVNALYGMLQWSGNDPVEWNNPYNPIVGTLGNPNFASAHLGIAGLASLAMTLGSIGVLGRLILAGNILLSLFVISRSDSSQGLLVFGLGAGVIFYIRFVRKYRALGLVYLGGFLSLVVVGVLGILNKGPLAGALYQDSVTYRGDYWRAGWKMTLENPLFGVGLDSYGDWYRFYRNEAAALRRGPDVTSNSAHNVFLDISSNGGFVLLLAYLFIVGLILRSSYRVLRRSVVFDSIGTGLVVSWLAYLVQSIISINQLGLAIWGWVLGGAIIGYDIYGDRAEPTKAKRVSGKRPEQVPASIALTGALGLAAGVLISIWPLAQDVSFRSALESGDISKIYKATKKFPGNTYFYSYAGDLFLQNKLDSKSLEFARRSIEINPRDINGWKLLIANPNIDKAERARAIVEMRKLDPFNNNLDE